jgi:CheY-like chemotaxis protein
MKANVSAPTERSSINLLDNPENWNALEGCRDDWERSAPKRILLVGYSPEKNESLVAALAEKGFSCETCNDGTEALKISRSEDFPIVAIWRGLPDVGNEDLARLLRAHTLHEAEIVLLANENFESAAEKLLQAHVEHVRKVRDNRLYGEVVGGAVFEGISRLRRCNESDESGSEESNRLHDAFRVEMKKLSLLDSEIARDEESLKGYLAEFLGKEGDGPPERLLERAIRAVRELNEGKIGDAPNDSGEHG